MATTRRLLLGAAVLALAACEAPPMDSVQTGYRGLGIEQVYNPDVLRERVANNQPPTAVPPLPAGTPTTPGAWQNVQVLGHLSDAEFNRTMTALTLWVAPQQGCAYCHVANPDGTVNYASDDNYTKVTSRRMLRMVQDINGNYQNHVAATGVTCWTCHRGNPVPENTWFYGPEWQPERHYLDRNDVRVQDYAVLASQSDNRSSIKQTERTYALMIDMSKSLGVNCTYCHNSARFADWDESPPTRVTALRGIAMTRHLNNDWILPLQSVLPGTRHGPRGDIPKIECATCHNGAYKPVYGVAMAETFPALYLPPPPPPPPADTTAGVGAADGN